MTHEQIKVMTALQLRKAVKDAGKDPMSDELGKGDPDKMRDFLTALYTPPTTAMMLEFTPIELSLEADPKKWPPVLPMSGGSYEQFKNRMTIDKPLYGAQAIAAAREESGPREVPMTVVNKNFDDRITTLELRVATLEQLLKISNGSTVAAPAQFVDEYTILAPYLNQSEGDGPELVLTVNQVPALTLEQKLLVLKLFGEPTDANTPPRVLNQRIVTALQKTK